MNRIAVIGSGDLGQLISHHINSDSDSVIPGFYDDFKDIGTQTPQGKILGGTNDVLKGYNDGLFDQIIIAIGYKHPVFRKKIFDELSNKIPIATFIHSSCYIDPSARVGIGSVLLPGCTIDMGVVIKQNTLLNTGCHIAHDTTIGAHCFLGPGVTLAGFIDVGENCFVGVGSTVIDNIQIAPNTQIGGGAVVTKNISSSGLYVGIPAQKKR